MAHFYGNMQGNRGECTRCGSKTSGINAHIRGWGVGVRTVVTVDANTGEDVVAVYLTSGSNGDKPTKQIGIFTRNDL